VPLTRKQTCDRRRLDLAVVRRSFPDHGGLVPSFRVFGSLAEAELGRQTTTPEHACIYDFELRIRSMIRGGGYHDTWTLRVDASLVEYPEVLPRLIITSTPRPWVAHVHETGYVCVDPRRPSPLVARHVLTVLRTLNWDTGQPPEYLRSHLNPDATDAWMQRHCGAPLVALSYPTVHDDMDVEPEPMFGAPQLAAAGASRKVASR
jgi:hypothetical protein